jgi:phosphoribosylformylglycinamidine synthase
LPIIKRYLSIYTNQAILLKNKEFNVIVTIENKSFINDPEGETIYHDLILKNKYNNIKSVRTAKVLKLIVNAKNPIQATLSVKKMCEDLRIFNPIVSDYQVNIISDE